MGLVHWSQFNNVGNPEGGDQLVGLREVDGALTNVRFDFNTEGDSLLQRSIEQTAHGFTVGKVLTLSGSTYILAQANSATTSDVIGAVIGVTDADNFILWFGGNSGTVLSALTAGTTYFLDPSVAGGYTSTAPTTPGQVRAPLFKADTTTSAYWIFGGGVQQL